MLSISLRNLIYHFNEFGYRNFSTKKVTCSAALIKKVIETNQSTTTNREAYERFRKGVKGMVAEKAEEQKTATERYKNDPKKQVIVAGLKRKR